jgi:hypothetical protein
MSLWFRGGSRKVREGAAETEGQAAGGGASSVSGAAGFAPASWGRHEKILTTIGIYEKKSADLYESEVLNPGTQELNGNLEFQTYVTSLRI